MKLAIRELRNNPLWSILGLIICFICFNTVFASLTNIGASVYQRKEFEENINIDLNKELTSTFNFLKSEAALKLLNLTKRNGLDSEENYAEILDFHIDESKKNIFAA